MHNRIAVLGGGAGACMLAADLAARGNEIALYIRPEAKEKNRLLFETKRITVTGRERFYSDIFIVTDDIEQAVTGAKYILLAAPAFMRETYIKTLHGHLKKDQILILYPGSFGSLV